MFRNYPVISADTFAAWWWWWWRWVNEVIVRSTVDKSSLAVNTTYRAELEWVAQPPSYSGGRWNDALSVATMQW